MSTPQAVFGHFELERDYPVSPEQVFAAWADHTRKARWFAEDADDWEQVERTLDFRVGGVERLKGAFASGPTTQYTARYHEIAPAHRVTYAYDLHVNATHVSVSLACAELHATPAGTRLRYTEHVAFLDGQDSTEVRRGTAAGYLERLATVLSDA